MDVWLNINLSVSIIVCACIVFSKMVLAVNEIKEPDWYKQLNGFFYIVYNFIAPFVLFGKGLDVNKAP